MIQILASMLSMVVGSTIRAAFEAYDERVLAPNLSYRQVVVMDNLSAHKGGRVCELIEDVGCEFVYLPPYSPDPKTPSKRPSQRSKGCSGAWGLAPARALIEAMGAALSSVSAQDVSGSVGHSGFPTLTQSL